MKPRASIAVLGAQQLVFALDGRCDDGSLSHRQVPSSSYRCEVVCVVLEPGVPAQFVTEDQPRLVVLEVVR